MLLQQSTCRSKVPWNDCSSLPPLPKPSFLSRAHQGNSCHLPAAEESEDPPGLKRQILSPQLQLWSSHQQSQSWWRHLCRCPFELVSSAPPTSPLDPSSQSFQRLCRCWATPPSHSPKPPPKVDQLVSSTNSFGCRRRWMWPWSSCSQKGPPWASDIGSWNWILNLLHAWMMLRLPKPSGRPRYSTRAQPMPFRSPLGQHAGVRTWGNGNGRVGPWSLHWSLLVAVWTCLLEFGGTTLPTLDPYQWHTPSCPAIGHRRQRYGTNISYPRCVGDFCTTDRWKMPALLLQPVHPLLKDWGRMKRRPLTVKCQKNALTGSARRERP